MYRLTRIFPDDTTHPHEPMAFVHKVIDEAVSHLVDADIQPRLARRFALHLSRQPHGTEVKHAATGWRFRIDELDSEDST